MFDQLALGHGVRLTLKNADHVIEDNPKEHLGGRNVVLPLTCSQVPEYVECIENQPGNTLANSEIWQVWQASLSV